MKSINVQTKPPKKESERLKELRTVQTLIRRYERVLEKGSGENLESLKGFLLQQEDRLKRLLLLSKTTQNTIYSKERRERLDPKQRLRIVGENIAFEEDLPTFEENEGRILAERKEIENLKQKCNASPEKTTGALRRAVNELEGLKRYLLRGGDTVRDIIGHTVSAIVSITLATLTILNPSILKYPELVENSPISTFVFSGAVCYLVSFNLLILGSLPYLGGVYLARKKISRKDVHSYEKQISAPSEKHEEIEEFIKRIGLERETWDNLETYLEGLLKKAQDQPPKPIG